MHDFRFPGESAEYRAARDELLRAEIELRRATEAVAARRRALPPGGLAPADYAFQDLDGRTVRMADLFEDGRDTILVYSFMFGPGDERPCSSCSSIADVLDGAARHVDERASLVFVAKSPPDRLRALVAERGWSRLRFLSSAGTTYNRDYYGETADGSQMTMLNVFTKDGDRIRHFWGTELVLAPPDEGQDQRHIDIAWPIWALVDMTPEGRPEGYDWPALDYDRATAR
jgi:predicted dithiol-disulfide oxidoreductase (DUF899 family)